MKYAAQPTPSASGTFTQSTAFGGLVCTLDQLRDLLVVRVSQASLEALLSQNEMFRRVHSRLPAIQRLAELPGEILHDSAEGAEVRRLHGVITVLRQDASVHAESPSMVMGYAIPVSPEALVLFIHDTAGDTNVFVPGDHLPRVAFSELMLGLLAPAGSWESSAKIAACASEGLACALFERHSSVGRAFGLAGRGNALVPGSVAAPVVLTTSALGVLPKCNLLGTVWCHVSSSHGQ